MLSEEHIKDGSLHIVRRKLAWIVAKMWRMMSQDKSTMVCSQDDSVHLFMHFYQQDKQFIAF